MFQRFRRSIGLFLALIAGPVFAAEPVKFWRVEDVRAGMKGYGETVLRGLKRERFEVDILGVLNDFDPGHDMIIMKVSGIGLEKTGVIAGMSGSPVYVDGKLLGAVAFTWEFNTEPIGGITPYAQMVDYSKSAKDRGRMVAEVSSYRLDGPVEVLTRQLRGTTNWDQGADASGIVATAGGARMVPIQTPVVVSGFNSESVEELSRHLAPLGMFPVQGAQGGASKPSTINPKLEWAKEAKIEAGGAMAVGLVTGDVSLTGIGTVTEVNEHRVYGFGHPFFEIGACELPLLTAYIHTVIPRQSISSKLGSAVAPVGLVDADVSTCVAGWLGRKPDTVPLSFNFKSGKSSVDRVFNCELAREPTLMGVLTLVVLNSCSSGEGQAPMQFTAKVATKVEIEGYPPFESDDVYSGGRFVGQRGLMQVYAPIANLLNVLTNNPYQRPKIKSVQCTAELIDQRQSATLLAARVANPILQAGEKLKIVSTLRPYRLEEGRHQVMDVPRDVVVELPIPADLPPGKYTVRIGDAAGDLDADVRNRPHLRRPLSFEQLADFLRLQLAVRRVDLVVRLNLPDKGLALDGVEFPELPPAMTNILSRDTARIATPVISSVVVRQPTSWAVEGSMNVSFEVVKEKSFYH